MPITVSIIEEKEFKTKVRGYDPVEVDEFLDEICDEMVAMENTIRRLTEQLNNQPAPTPFTPAPAPIVAPPPLAPTVSADSLPSDLKAAQKLLSATQRTCDEVIADAKKRAESILQEAKDQVPDPELTDLEAQRDEVRKEIDALKAEAETFRKRFRSLLNDQNEILEAELF